MKAILSAVLMLFPLLCHAEGRSFTPQAPTAEQQAQHEKHMRTARAIGLADALDLDADAAIKLSAQLNGFDDRRKASFEALRETDEALRKAAEGSEAATVAQVDQLLARRADAQAQLQQVEREMLASASKGLTGQQKARLALFLARPHGGPGMHGEGMHGGHELGHEAGLR
jgi:hypothetical protein